MILCAAECLLSVGGVHLFTCRSTETPLPHVFTGICCESIFPSFYRNVKVNRVVLKAWNVVSNLPRQLHFKQLTLKFC